MPPATANLRTSSTAALAAMARLMAQMGLAEVLVESGEIDEAAAVLEGVAAIAVSDAQRLLRLEQMRILVQLARGDAPGARAGAEALVAALLDRGIRTEAAEMALTLAAALRAEGGPGATQRIEEVLGVADRLIAETGACNLAPFVLLERAASLTRDEDALVRRELLERALAEFTRMEATGRVREVAQMLEV